ncbi:hypothetical protein COSO111634_24475 [Corallococcus soli]
MSSPFTRVRSHQSSSTMRVAGTPQYSRCAPTPNGTTKVVFQSFIAVMVAKSRWS